jgi:hypothetical protein
VHSSVAATNRHTRFPRWGTGYWTEQYWIDLYTWFANGGNEIVAHYLANLDLSGSSVTDAGLIHLRNCPTLTDSMLGLTSPVGTKTLPQDSTSTVHASGNHFPSHAQYSSAGHDVS